MNTEAKKPDETLEPSEEGGLVQSVYEWGRTLSGVLTWMVLLFVFLVQIVSVQGSSMENTLYTNDRLLVLNRCLCSIQRGDIVIVDAYNAPLNDISGTIVKRVIATGGQTVDIDFVTGTVYVDGQPLSEPYCKESTYVADGITLPLTLAEDELFVMGDNRNHSTDSRSSMLGPVKLDYVQGKAIFLLFPGKTAGLGQREYGRIGRLS